MHSVVDHDFPLLNQVVNIDSDKIKEIESK